jgi:hypothetical protein
VLVEHEQRNDLAAFVPGGTDRFRERRMVGKAQVLAAIPDEGSQATW